MSVGQQALFSKSNHRIFLKFYMKLEGRKVQKLMDFNFQKKFHFGEKSQTFLQNRVQWVLPNIQSIDVSIFIQKIVHSNVLL